MNDERNISNIKVSKECYKRLKVLSIEKEIKLQEVITNILENIKSYKEEK